VVSYEKYRIGRTKHGLEFRLENSLKAIGMESFRDYAIAKARDAAAEGYVLQLDERYMLPPYGGPSSQPDNWGQRRAVAAIKLKEEFALTLMAVKAQDERIQDEPRVYLYERCQAPYEGKVRYVADVSDNTLIVKIMEKKAPVFAFETDEELKPWYHTDFDALSLGGVILVCRCAGVTVNYFLGGVKQYHVEIMPTHTTGRLMKQDLQKLSTVKDVADKNAHFRAMKEK
jgi:hypothetical protein